MTLSLAAPSNLARERSVPALRNVGRPHRSRHEECERDCAKGLHDIVQALAANVVDLTRCLEQAQNKVAQLERLGVPTRVCSPLRAGPIPGGSAVNPIDTHRRQVTVVFIDLRRFTAFSETAEPEDVLEVLREYHAEMGRLIAAHAGVLERFTGDGMAFDMRERLGQLTLKWRKRNYDLDFAVGVAQGHATIGPIGFEGRWDYRSSSPGASSPRSSTSWRRSRLATSR